MLVAILNKIGTPATELNYIHAKIQTKFLWPEIAVQLTWPTEQGDFTLPANRI
jgi:hypothetical protein